MVVTVNSSLAFTSTTLLLSLKFTLQRLLETLEMVHPSTTPSHPILASPSTLHSFIVPFSQFSRTLLSLLDHRRADPFYARPT